MKILMKLSILVPALIFIISVSSAANGQDGYFKILSFKIDGKEFKDYSVTFNLEGREIVPSRTGNKVYVPREVQEADFVGVKFRALQYGVTFEPLGIQGYKETDEVKADYAVEVTNPSQNCTGDECKIIYSLTRIPILAPDSRKFADPVKFTVTAPYHGVGKLQNEKKHYDLRLRGKVTSIEVENRPGNLSRIDIKLSMKLVNAGKKPIILVKKNPLFPGVYLARTPEDFETSNMLAVDYKGESNSSAPEWGELRRRLDRDTPPAADTQILMPDKSLPLEETVVGITVPTTPEVSLNSTRKECFDVIRKLSSVWLQVNSQLWSWNIEKLDPNRDKLVFGYKLQERWKDTGFLWMDDIDSEPMLLDLSTAKLVTKKPKDNVDVKKAHWTPKEIGNLDLARKPD